MTPRQIHTVISILRCEIKRWKTPIVGVIAEESRDPYRVLISCLLSLRTQDRTTEGASRRLFEIGTRPDQLVRLAEKRIASAIYPVSFYRTKSRTIRRVSQILIDQYAGKVPDTMERLLELPGVGRKTANLVLTLGFRKPGICVDTHVHRISNRWGYVRTKSPDETEIHLRRRLPHAYWIEYNDLLVPYGQNLCTPISPFCSRCPIGRFCDRVGVPRSR